MKVAEFLIGALLVTTGVLGPTAYRGDVALLDGNVQGTARFLEADYDGQARVHASDALVLAQGPFEATVTGEHMQVTVYEYERQTASVVAGYGFETHYKTQDHVRELAYETAELALAGENDGVLHIWPQADPATARFTLSLTRSHEPAIFASAHGAAVASDDARHRYVMEGPVFGLTNGGPFDHTTELSRGGFDHLGATGTLRLVVSDADLTITHAGGTELHELRTRPGQQAEVQSPGGQLRVGSAVGTRVSYAVVTFPAGSIDMGFHDVGATLLSRDPTWAINGTVTLDAEQGQVRTGEEKRDLRGDRVEFVGNTTLSLSAEGNDPRPPVLDGWGLPRGALPQPKVDALIDGEAQEVRVNGEPLKITQPGLPGEVGLVAKLLGVLLVAWSIGRKVLGFGVFLLIRDPLDNDRRRRIYAYIQEVGIAHMRQIKRMVDIPIGSLAYHLRVLKGARLVSSVRRAGYQVWFIPVAEFGREDMEHLALLVDPTRREIAEAVGCQESVTQSELATSLDLNVSSVSRQLSTLVDAGLVTYSNGGHERRYAPTEFLTKWLERRGRTGSSQR